MKVLKKIFKWLGWLLLSLAVLVLLILALVGYEFRDEIHSLRSIQPLIDRENAHVYQVEIQGDYHMDDFLSQGGVTSTLDLVSFLTKAMTRGTYTFNKGIGEAGGCSSYTAQTSDGDRLFARNFDLDHPAPLAVIYTRPDDGRHASVSTSNLGFVGVGKSGIQSMADRLLALAAAYVPMDGMNDQGLAVSLHMSYQGPNSQSVGTDQQSDRFDVTSTTLVRLILDHADNVDEAVDLARQVDLHDDINSSMQYFVADASGRSAVLHWVAGTDQTDTDGGKRELEVIYSDQRDNPYVTSDNYRILTNFITQPGYYQEGDDMAGLDRFELLNQTLAQTDGTLENKNQAMTVLSQVSWARMVDRPATGATVYSVVYNLTDRTVLLVPYEGYDRQADWLSYRLE